MTFTQPHHHGKPTGATDPPRPMVRMKQVNCAICRIARKQEPAVIHGLMKNGVWQYMCAKHWISRGVGLGEGKGRWLS